MTEQEEQYVHLVECIKNFNCAWVILQEIKENKGNPILISAAFQFALIEYAKSYTTSRGTVQKHVLDERYIPDEHSELHRRILKARHQIHAHSDLTVKEVKLFVTKTPDGKIAGQLENNIKGTEELSNIDSILDLIEQTLDKIYLEEKQLEQQLTVNS